MERLQRFQNIIELSTFCLILQGTEAPNFAQVVPAACRLRVELAVVGSDTSLKNKGKGELSTSVLTHFKIESHTEKRAKAEIVFK